jgi:S-DNA-T family DNA segregation ATPase FtsK/SpoIIIE
MDACDECGFTYADHVTLDLATEIHALGGRFESLLTNPSVDRTRLTTRLRPPTWSPVEYGCHVRDVLLAQRERLLLALVEHEPTIVSIYREQRAVLARYGDETPGQVANGIAFAANLFAWTLNGLAGPDWDRTCIFSYPEPSRRTIAWLGQHTLHEGEHHLLDIRRALEADPMST